MKDYVLGRAFDPLLLLVEEQGLSEEPLVEGLSFTHKKLKSSFYQRVPWNEFSIYFERLEELAGAEAIDELGKTLPRLVSFQTFARAAGILSGPRWYYALSKHWFGPTMFPAIPLVEYREVGPRTLRVVMEIPEPLRDCPQFFRATASFDREGPIFLGMDAPLVQMKLSTRRAVYTITYPPKPSLLARVRQAVKAALSSDQLLQEYIQQHESLVSSVEQSRRMESSFQELVRRSPDGVVIFDDREIRYLNEAMLTLLGVDDAPDLVGEPINKICPDPPLFIADSQGDEARRQTTFVHADGHLVQGEMKSFHAHFQGSPVMVAIVRDVTEQNEVLARAMEMDRVIATGMQALSVGHEIKNPLSYVHSNLAYVNDLFTEGVDELTPEELEDAAEALQTTIQGVERIQAITRDLDAFARAPREELEPIDLEDALKPCLRWIKPELHDRARLLLELKECGPVRSDTNRISQVVLNLLVNAAHAIEPGAFDDNSITLRTYPNGDLAVIEVEDTGCGIEEDMQEEIFAPFFTTQPAGQGTGLGLFLSRNIVERLQGTLTVDSTVGQGTCMRLTLPLARSSS